MRFTEGKELKLTQVELLPFFIPESARLEVKVKNALSQAKEAHSEIEVREISMEISSLRSQS